MYLDISCVYCSSDEELDQEEGKLVCLVHVSLKSFFAFSSHEVFKSLFVIVWQNIGAFTQIVN